MVIFLPLHNKLWGRKITTEKSRRKCDVSMYHVRLNSHDSFEYLLSISTTRLDPNSLKRSICTGVHSRSDHVTVALLPRRPSPRFFSGPPLESATAAPAPSTSTTVSSLFSFRESSSFGFGCLSKEEH